MTRLRACYPQLAIILALLGAAACNEISKPTQVTRPNLRGRQLTAADSALYLQNRAGTFSAAAGPPSTAIPVSAGDTVRITLIDAECGAVGETVTISGAISGTLNDVCVTKSGQVFTGVVAASGQITLTINNPVYGPGSCIPKQGMPPYLGCDDGYGDLDYNDAIVWVEIMSPPDSLQVDCDNYSPTRGDPISCSVTRPQNETIASWTFVPSDTMVGSAPITRSDPDLTAPWSGTMVSSGVVIVTATNGEADSATIQVSNRLWDKTQLPPINKQDLGDGIVRDRKGIPLWDPPVDSVLGQGSNWVELAVPIVPSTWWTLVSGGPNNGLSYSTSVPGPIQIQTSVNEKALKAGSKFYNLQPDDPAPAPYCGKQWVIDRLALTRLHEGEGPTPHPQSHPETTTKGYADYYVKWVESFIRRGYPTTFDVRGLAQRGQAKATAVTNALTHSPDPLIPWYFTCVNKAY